MRAVLCEAGGEGGGIGPVRVGVPQKRERRGEVDEMDVEMKA